MTAAERAEALLLAACEADTDEDAEALIMAACEVTECPDSPDGRHWWRQSPVRHRDRVCPYCGERTTDDSEDWQPDD